MPPACCASCAAGGFCVYTKNMGKSRLLSRQFYTQISLPLFVKTSGQFAFIRVHSRLFSSLKPRGQWPLCLLPLSLCLLTGCKPSRSEAIAPPPAKIAVKAPSKVSTPPPGNQTDATANPLRVRPDCPIRLGGVFLRGLSDNPDAQEDSASNGTKLTDTNRDWVAANCDVAAFSAANVQPDTFRQMTRAHSLFTPLLYLYASSLYEMPGTSRECGRMAACNHERVDAARPERAGGSSPR